MKPGTEDAESSQEYSAKSADKVETWSNLGHPGWLVFSTILIFLLSQLAATVVIELLLLPSHRSFDNSIVAQFFFVVLSALGYALLVKWFLKRRRLGWASIGLGRRPRWNDLKRAVLGLVILLILSAVVNLLITQISPSINQQKQDLGFNNPGNNIGYFLAFCALVLSPAIGEEILMRGYLYSGLRRWWKIPAAALLTSFIFALPHLFESQKGLLWAAGIDTFMLSFILIYLRERTGALYAGMVVHAGNNLLAFIVYFHGLILLR
jgi:membrane protease YdiL (CAAX protease family)